MNLSQTPIIAIIEDDVSFAHYLKKLFLGKGVKVVGLAHSVKEFLLDTTIPFEEIQCILLDINLSGGEIGIDQIPQIKKKAPEVDIIVLTMHDEAKFIFQALCNGALGYLTKGTGFDEIHKSVLDVINGGSAMTPSIARKVVDFFVEQSPSSGFNDLSTREFDIVIGIKDGLSYKLIADRYGLSIDGVRFHVKNIYKKLHVNSKSEVINAYFQSQSRK